MKNLKITFKLVAGVAAALSENPFDGVLAKLSFEKQKREGTFDGDFAQRLPFLEWNEGGFYHISNPFYRVEGIENRTIFKSFDTEKYREITGNRLTKAHYNLGSGPYKAYVVGYEYQHVKEVIVYARGDRGVIEELLKGLTHLGKKSGHGAGEIASIIVEEIEQDLSIFGEDGELHRPVPFKGDFLKRRNPYRHNPAVRLMALTHPYWDKGREVPVVIPYLGRRFLGENKLTKFPVETLAKVFGFDRNQGSLPKGRKIRRVEGNTTEKCKMCGRIHSDGFHDPTNHLINGSTNAFYTYIHPRNPFLCDFCRYNYSHYMKKLQKKLDKVYGDMSNIILFADRAEVRWFNSDDKNELYDILMNPPKEPFAVIIKELAGTSAVNGTHRFVPTIDSGYICVNYGAEQHFVSSKTVFEMIERAEVIFAVAKKKKIKLAEDVLFNRMKKEDYNNWLTENVLMDDELHAMMSDWFSNYDHSHRFVGKMILRRYRKENKHSKKERNHAKK